MYLLYVLFFLVFAQTTSSNQDLTQLITTIIRECSTQITPNYDGFTKSWEKLIAPEDDADFALAFSCIFKSLNIIKNNEFHGDVLKKLIPSFIKLRFGLNWDEAQEVANEVSDKCFQLPVESPLELYGIRVTSNNQDVSELITSTINDCIKKNSIDYELFIKYWKELVIKEDSNFTKGFLCVFEDLNIIKNDEFQIDVMKNLLPSLIKLRFEQNWDKAQEVANKVSEKCYQLSSDSSIVYNVIQLRNCLVSEIKAVIV
ncbi:hypothetical protein FQR65_LT07866 [Abscondita terminalis]|nr:hypothetical protein FQR65_LT07866 [Abscondita terminalis]